MIKDVKDLFNALSWVIFFLKLTGNYENMKKKTSINQNVCALPSIAYKPTHYQSYEKEVLISEQFIYFYSQ